MKTYHSSGVLSANCSMSNELRYQPKATPDFSNDSFIQS